MSSIREFQPYPLASNYCAATEDRALLFTPPSTNFVSVLAEDRASSLRENFRKKVTTVAFRVFSGDFCTKISEEVNFDDRFSVKFECVA